MSMIFYFLAQATSCTLVTAIPHDICAEQLDEHLILPGGAQKKASYDKYFLDEGMYIKIRYVESQKKSQFYVVNGDKFPLIFDGGCAVINAIFDKVSGKYSDIWCNGGA